MAHETQNLESIQPDAILYSLQSADRTDAFTEMVGRLLEIKLIPSDLKTTVLEGLEARESKLSTAIGRGLAIPHATIHELPSVVRLLARSQNGIPAGATDGAPVHFFYLTLIPDHHYATHLRTIAAISSFFRDPHVHEKLLAAQSEEELSRLFNA